LDVSLRGWAGVSAGDRIPQRSFRLGGAQTLRRCESGASWRFDVVFGSLRWATASRPSPPTSEDIGSDILSGTLTEDPGLGEQRCGDKDGDLMRTLKFLPAQAPAIALLMLVGGRAADAQNARQAPTAQPQPVADFDGNTYRTVGIGTQVWMAENLHSTHYSDGAPIQSFAYNNDTANARVYGRLYRWLAAMRNAPSSSASPSGVQGACPQSWHVPSNAEWQQLIGFLGGESVAGGKLKEAGALHWSRQNGATNESGFGALPAGWFDFTGAFDGLGGVSFIRTSTAEGPRGGHAAELLSGSASISLVHLHPDDAIPIRCVKDL